ncbi:MULTISPECIES: prolyl-tRNA synthetase associated domain-containing protein [Lactobacillus]|uniref:prolyl-tRNA synthetase associated domain-containing protein n=1 Tax=Lactobacillus TaxID=1578 RepID=UPI000D6FAD25|nr:MULTISPECIES: prolyl-tRNA synthetase associated domain-containing protein [Lactobacillus]AWN33133.1 prolyl-tRNA editing protein [Lactobacillus helsingborgensis]RMC53598.1 prolyl-tRNA synthetase associated domain-containing protein [Lactobacillus sp. ESL0262]
MNKNETLHYLNQLGIKYEIVEHPAVYNMAEIEKIALPHPEADAKNLFVRDDKKRNYYLLTIKGDKRVNLQQFREENGTRRLSFASPQDLKEKLGLEPGSVTPLGLLNDPRHEIPFYLDSYFSQQPRIAVHPNDNTATIWLKPQALIHFIRDLGNPVKVVKM